MITHLCSNNKKKKKHALSIYQSTKNPPPDHPERKRKQTKKAHRSTISQQLLPYVLANALESDIQGAGGNQSMNHELTYYSYPARNPSELNSFIQVTCQLIRATMPPCPAANTITWVHTFNTTNSYHTRASIMEDRNKFRWLAPMMHNNVFPSDLGNNPEARQQPLPSSTEHVLYAIHLRQNIYNLSHPSTNKYAASRNCCNCRKIISTPSEAQLKTAHN